MINILAFTKNWLSAASEGLMGGIMSGIRTLCFSLCTFIYQAIIFVYNIFEKLCKGRFLSSEILEAFAERVGVILGLLMAFIVIFSLIKIVLDPDKLNDKEMGAGALIKKIIITIVLLGVSNYIFNLLYLVQKTVIESDAISKLLLPVQIDKENSDNFGKILSIELLSAFYYVDTERFEGEVPSEVAQCQGLVNEFQNQVVRYGNFELGYQCLNESIELDSEAGISEEYIVNYNWLISVVVGVVVLYLLFVYCINIGVRMVQLMFLEIIAPMAIVSYVSPKKDNMFSKWTKIYIATYLDVFIRIAIINFVVFIIATIFASTENGFAFWGSVSGGAEIATSEKKFITVIIVVALLTFAKKAPELLKELLPASASKLGFGMSSPKQLFDGMLGGKTVAAGAKMATIGTAIGAGAALTSGISRYRMNMKGVDKSDKEALWKARGKGVLAGAGGAFMAAGRGLKAGATSKGNVFSSISKGLTAQKGIDDKYDELISSGGSPLGSFTTKLSSYLGETAGQTYTRHLNNLDQISKFKKDMNSAADEFSFVKSAKDAWENVVQFKGESLEAYEKRKSEAFTRYRKLRNGVIEASLNGENVIKFTEDVIDEKSGKVVISAGSKYEFSEDPDNAMYASDIVSTLTQAEAFRESHNVQRWDEVKKTYVNIESFKTKVVDKDGKITYEITGEARGKLGDATNDAHKTKTHITGSEDYSRAIANDKNAGVNSNATTKK